MRIYIYIYNIIYIYIYIKTSHTNRGVDWSRTCCLLLGVADDLRSNQDDKISTWDIASRIWYTSESGKPSLGVRPSCRHPLS